MLYEVITFTYKDDELSVICDGLSENIDYFNVPNIFIAVVSSPEVAELKSVYINTNPASPLSTSGRGRKIVSQIYKPDMISSQSQLDEYRITSYNVCYTKLLRIPNKLLSSSCLLNISSYFIQYIL